MLCLGCIQVPGSEAEHENEEEEEQEEGSVISEQGPQNQDVRTFACRDPPKAVKVAAFPPPPGKACDTSSGGRSRSHLNVLTQNA